MCLCLCAQSYLWRPEISRYPEVEVTPMSWLMDVLGSRLCGPLQESYIHLNIEPVLLLISVHF